MKNVITGWNLFRLLRLIASLAITAQGIYLHDWIFFIAGLIFVIITLLHRGCCAGITSNSHEIDEKRIIDNTVFEEVV